MSSIKSFTEIGVCKVLSSDWLYPSNFQKRPIEAKGSIQESIGNNNEIFNCEEITSTWHYCGKPLRAVVRSICFLAVGNIMAPIGIVYHGCFIVKETVVYLTADQADSAESWKKVTDHAKVFFIDLMFACFSYAFIYLLVKTGRYINKGLPHLSQNDHQAIIGCNIFFGLFGINPKMMVPYIVSPDDRAPLYKTVSLRNDFGITAMDGSLLPYNRTFDQESLDLKGHFGELMRAQALDLLYLINDIQSTLPPDSKIKAHYPPHVNTIITHLQKFKEKNYAAEIEQLRNLDSNMKKMSNLLKECLEIKENSLFGQKKIEITMPGFPFIKSFVEKFFNEAEFTKADTPKTIWDRSLEQAINELKQCKPFIGASEKYKKVKERILAKAEPYEILGVQAKPTLAELRKSYKSLTLLFHPDRVPAEFQEEAVCIFKCVGSAYDILK